MMYAEHAIDNALVAVKDALMTKCNHTHEDYAGNPAAVELAWQEAYATLAAVAPLFQALGYAYKGEELAARLGRNVWEAVTRLHIQSKARRRLDELNQNVWALERHYGSLRRTVSETTAS